MQQLDCLEGWRACRMKQSAAKYKNTTNTIKESIIINVLCLLKIVPNNNSRKKKLHLALQLSSSLHQAYHQPGDQHQCSSVQAVWRSRSLACWSKRFKVGCWTKNRGGFYPPKWMVKIRENLIKMDDLGVPIFLGWHPVVPLVVVFPMETPKWHFKYWLTLFSGYSIRCKLNMTCDFGLKDLERSWFPMSFQS